MKKNFKELSLIMTQISEILSNKQKKKTALLIIVMIIGAVFELFGVSAVIPFAQAAMAPEMIYSYPYVKDIMAYLNIETGIQITIMTGVFLIIVYIVKNVYLLFAYYMRYDYAAGVQKELSDKLLNIYLKKPYEYHLSVNSATIVRTCTADTDGVYQMIVDIAVLSGELFTCAVIALFLIATDPFIAIGVMVMVVIALMAMIHCFKPAVKRAGKNNLEAGTLKNKAIMQTSSGIKEIMVMERQGQFEGNYRAATETQRKSKRTYDMLRNSPDRIVEGVCVGGIIGVICLKIGFSSEIAQDLVPELGAFAVAAFRMFPSVGKITGRINSVIYNRPALDATYKLLSDNSYGDNSEKLSAKSSSQAIVDRSKSPAGGEKALEFKDSLYLKNVSFSYSSSSKVIIDDLNLKIKKGESVAFIGASGSGKTTLSDIILGLLHPQEGEVLVDGKDVINEKGSWSKMVGYVPQSIFLSDDSIRDNVVFGSEISDDEAVWDALDRAQIGDFVRGLSEGLGTLVGERGIRFSGGQRQRIAIARALYQKPEILILDEATAALDNETENSVMEAIESFQGKVTLIIIAHRLTTIRNCDAVYEIVNGTAVKRDIKDVL